MLLKKKSGAFDAFKIFKAYAETHFGTKLKALQDDKGGEYMSKEFIKFTDSCGIQRRPTGPCQMTLLPCSMNLTFLHHSGNIA
jgi:hypothetical protein